jgi:hypothetical protein
MKSPPKQFTDDEARQMVEDFIQDQSKKGINEPQPKPGPQE